MARLLRVQYPGAIYHVTVRGNDRRVVFRDDGARRRFLQQLGQRVEAYEIRLYLYCLLANHTHLVFETPQGNLSAFMQSLLTAYTVYFNRRYRRSGHVTDGRYGAKLVEGDGYLDALTRYVHLNPVRTRKLAGAELAAQRRALTAYPWSSYRAYIGRVKAPPLLECEPVLAMMPGKKPARRGNYRQFVEAGLAETDEEFTAVLKASRLAIGGETFRNRVRDMHYALIHGSERPEDAALRRVSPLVDAETVMRVVCRHFGVERESVLRRQRGTPLRPVVARCLCRYAGLAQRDAALVLGLRTGVAISQQLSRLTARLAKDRRLARLVARIEKEIGAGEAKEA